MVKKSKKSKDKISAQDGGTDLPALDAKQDEALRSVMRELAESSMPQGAWPIPTPIDVHFLVTSDRRREARFMFSMFHHPLHPEVIRFNCELDIETVRDASKRGQEAIWEWLRDHSVLICTQAVARNLVMPDRISVQIGESVRFYDVDRDLEFLARVNAAARVMAMHAVAGREVSE